MSEIISFLSDGKVQAIIFMWMIVIGLGVLIYSFSVSQTRKKTLNKVGVLLDDSVDSSNTSKVESVSRWFGQLFSISERDVEKKFVAAGFYNSKWFKWLLPIKYISMALGILVILFYTMTMHMELTTTIILIALWLSVVVVGPDLYLELKKKKLQRKLSDRLPYLLDLMGVCVRTGMTIEASIAYLAHEMQGFDPDISHMLHKTNERAKLVGLESALEELYNRVPTNEVRSFVMTLNQSLQYGSSIYDVLSNLAKDIRDVHMLELEEKIGKLAAQMSIPLILFIMFPIVILITAPGIMRMLGG
ncbi:type II secretion system F family protein [Vibrio sp. D404a]|uniref:type II secretion system F family protein n=1 Tax=unclassified Vibrio TaxID=2614977 RepID=UPI0025559B31|nr:MULTISPECIES: type II secretion system F family protein [unclassified Vibrio]MDK9738692.1 type II secretion system F family protein [Vibrio sp. D404a]MDK9795496.1 type II secretion system F family protein [Vibrio sp. D449a]